VTFYYAPILDYKIERLINFNQWICLINGKSCEKQ